MIELLRPYKLEEGNEYISECLRSGWISYSGPLVARLERKMAEYTGAKYAVAVGSGTGGLWLTLKAMGIGAGDQVIVPSMTFVATVNAVVHTGAEPVFVDCDEDYNMNIDSLDQALCMDEDEAYGKSCVKAIMPVHMLGNLCNMPKIMKLARKYKVPVIEDAAQALGTRNYKGRHAGTFGKVGMISFSFNKMITGGGGGILLTNSKRMAQRLKYLSLQAKDDEVFYIHNESGFNMGMSSINAALVLSQLEMIDEILAKKKHIHDMYRAELNVKHAKYRNNWLNSIESDLDFEDAHKILSKLNIQTRPLFHPNENQEPFIKHIYYGDMQSYECYIKTICLPSSTDMTDEEVEYVIQSVKKVV